MWRRRSDAELPLVVGHRGASAIESENSVAAFARARADGADGVELDVMTCGTGEVVVFHDDDLVRLGSRPEMIAETPFAVLRALTLTSGAKIPTLEEVFEACGPDLLVNVELKIPSRGPVALAPLVDGVAAIVERAGAGERVLVSSFHPGAVRLWMRRLPAVRAGLLFERDSPLPLRRAWAAPLLRPFALHPELVLCTPDRVRGWHARGYMVNVWTVDEPAALAACRRMRVDAVITNDPARARAALSG
ncbi:MAG TPA: glycerophosphodiester phosphodiesterase [Polyangia bacterium]|nr:glycerophosphodiester phosphodiesterase [Polyangia bacterium]